MMAECLSLAVAGRGHVSPNPLVGAVLVRGTRIVSSGAHRRFGDVHAEVECLSRYNGPVSATTLFVNLEPCAHFGKTPPCVDEIIKKRIPRVVVAMKDPNPLVAGKGIAALRRAGVQVLVGTLRNEAEELNREFILHITTHRPYVHAKLAQTLDGKIAPMNRKRAWISSLPSRRLVHQWRGWHDAVLVGAGTIKADNPLLTTRMVKGRNPDVIILDGRFSIAGNARVFSMRSRRVFLCVCEEYLRLNRRKASLLERLGVEVLAFEGKAGRISPRVLLRELYRHRIGSILLEGGRDVLSTFIQASCVDKLSVFIAPTIMGEGVEGFQVKKQQVLLGSRVQSTVIGKDILISMNFERGR